MVGLAALVLVDYFQLEVPELYRMVVNGINTGVVETAEGTVPFDLNFLLDQICLPLIFIILVMVVGRFTWRICFFGTGHPRGDFHPRSGCSTTARISPPNTIRSTKWEI